jgi:hypothetical protein
MPITTLISGTTNIVVEYIQVTGVWNIRKSTFSSTGVQTINYTKPVTAPVFPSCDVTASYFDGMQIGWGVVAAMAAAASVPFLKKAMGF